MGTGFSISSCTNAAGRIRETKRKTRVCCSNAPTHLVPSLTLAGVEEFKRLTVDVSRFLKPIRRSKAKFKRTNRGQTIQLPIRVRQQIWPHKGEVEFGVFVRRTQIGLEAHEYEAIDAASRPEA